MIRRLLEGRLLIWVCSCFSLGSNDLCLCRCLIRNLAGDEGNFLVTTQAYSPPWIRCQVQPLPMQPASDACKIILNSMRAGTENTTFAVLGVEGDVMVPLVLTERKKFPNIVSFWLTLRRTATERCTITIYSTVPDDSASWYELWQAAVAVDGMCARQGQAGKARFLGEFSRREVWELLDNGKLIGEQERIVDLRLKSRSESNHC